MWCSTVIPQDIQYFVSPIAFVFLQPLLQASYYNSIGILDLAVYLWILYWYKMLFDSQLFQEAL